MPQELPPKGTLSGPKTYQPNTLESEMYQLWEKAGIFAPNDEKNAEPFCIIAPPPNANGAMHIGHAVGVALGDLMIRYHRMLGEATLWLPGFDHAGFETQVVFDKKLEKEGRSRFTIPRQQLYQEMYDFTKANIEINRNQFRQLGASLDWSREKFTLEPEIIALVYQTFKTLYDDGLVYRGERPVHWCTKHQTSLSDLEVMYEERTDPLYYIRYGPLTLATVRPETKFGDTAVAVNPNDSRYQAYIGKEIEFETLLGPAKLKVIADDYVNSEFGTGVVKITPAHDPNDFELSQRHHLPAVEVIDQYGRLNEKAGPYAGLKIHEARARVVADLQAKGLIEKIDPNYRHTVGLCYKCRTVIEPRILPQWFVAMAKTGQSGKNLRDDAVAAIKTGKVGFVSKKFEKVFYRWMENLRDWNISRQIVWGIRLPVFYCQKSQIPNTKSQVKSNDQNSSNQTSLSPPTGIIPDRGSDSRSAIAAYASDSSELHSVGNDGKDSPCSPIVTDGSIPEVCPSCGGNNLTQDPDVFDTWFSSAQWPFAALLAQSCSNQKPETRNQKLSDFNRFYPTNVMETGYDILFFWVARMIMMGLYVTDQAPFRQVYLHGLVRDKDRQKMSKSKGNVIDPLGVAAEYGADAVRLALIFGTAAGSDIVISQEKIRGMRNFANKLWNISRFILMNLEAISYQLSAISRITPKTAADKKILDSLTRLVADVTTNIEQFQFHLAAEKLYDFLWHELADTYLEASKAQRDKDGKIDDTTQAILLATLLTTLKLLHPFMPFVTEAIYQSLPIEGKPKLLASSSWPTKKNIESGM